jgi:hypothetical protein
MEIPHAFLIAALIFSLVLPVSLIIALWRVLQKKLPVILPAVILCQVAVSFTQGAVMLIKAMEGDFDFILWAALAQYIVFQALVVSSYSTLFTKWKQLHETNTQG